MNDTRKSFGGFWLFVAFIGVVVSAVCIAQARYQSEVEQGIEGSYQIDGCGRTSSARSGPYGWSCHGAFRPASGAEPKFATMKTNQSEEPRGRLTVMAADLTDDVVWLPSDVSSRRQWTWAVLSFVLITVPALAMFCFWGRRHPTTADG